MRFAFTEDQLLFRDAVRDFLAKECPPERVREAWAGPSGHLPDVWSGLADMGVTGLLVPEAHGGLGMSDLDLVLLLEETGRVALPGPFVDTVAVAAPTLASLADGDRRTEWLGGIADGSVLVATGLGSPFVGGADTAHVLLLESSGRLAVVPSVAASLEAQPSVDGARKLFSVEWPDDDAYTVATGEEAGRLTELAFDRGALAAAAQLVGLADRMLELTVDYVKQREQFGVPIGSFQAVKHQLADALLAVSFARPVVYNAAYSLSHGRSTRWRDVSMAKALASDAAVTVSRHALQCHGAIGYTVEYDLHLYMKRAWALAATWGDASWHRNRVGVALGI